MGLGTPRAASWLRESYRWGLHVGATGLLVWVGGGGGVYVVSVRLCCSSCALYVAFVRCDTRHALSVSQSSVSSSAAPG